MSDAPRRTVRSFVQRSRKLSPKQEQEYAQLWQRFGVVVPPNGPVDVAGLFDRAGPITLEIGFGRGEMLLAQAQAEPDSLLLGVEVYRPGVHKVLRAVAAAELTNVRVLCTDAAPLMSRLPAGSLDGIRILFPDPWPKARHHKRRLIQSAFLTACASTLASHGLLHLATDWQPYAEEIAELVQTLDWQTETPPPRPVTHFEQRGLRRAHTISEWAVRKP